MHVMLAVMLRVAVVYVAAQPDPKSVRGNETCDRSGSNMTELHTLSPMSPARYAETFAHFEDRVYDEERVMDEALASALNGRATGWSMLDVGAGTGAVLQQIVAAGFEPGFYMGVEPNLAHHHELMKYARTAEFKVQTSLEYANPESVSRICAGNLYDFILLSHSIYYVPEPAETLKRLSLCLAPGGEMLVFVQTMGLLGHAMVVALGELLPDLEKSAHDVNELALAANLRKMGVEHFVRYYPYDFELLGIFEPDGGISFQMREVLSFLLTHEFLDLPAWVQQALVQYIRAMATQVDGRDVWHTAVSAITIPSKYTGR